MNAVMNELVLPEREEITLKPCKGFPRRLLIEWEPHGVKVTMCARAFGWLALISLEHAQLSLVASKPLTLQQPIYCLRAGKTSFQLSPREFDSLAAKLEPRGVKVTRP